MSSPDIGEAERRAVARVLESPILSMGEETRAFEQAVVDYVGGKQAIAVSSGTAGLHLCVRAAEISPGDLVLTTPFSFVASSNVLLYEQAVPVFVDVDPASGNVDPAKLAEAATDLAARGEKAKRWLPRVGAEENGNLRAILAVDVFGQPADYGAIQEVAKEHSLLVIEDSCEAFGAEHKKHPAGRLGDCGVFAFYPNKQMTTGEGGVIVTDDGRAADYMRSLRNQGRASGDTWLAHTYLGYNYRMTEMSAALGRAQLERLDELLKKRQQVADWYGERLAEVEGLDLPSVLPDTTRMSWFVYVVRLARGVDRDEVMQELKAKRIPSRPYFTPIHLQAYMRAAFGYREGDFPVTEDLGRRGLALPFSSGMREDEVDLVSEALIESIKD